MDDEEFCVPDDVLEEASAAKPRSREKTKAASARLFNVEEYTVCISKRLYLQVSRFNSLTSFLKTKCRNYQAKKATTSSRNDVCKFYWKRRTKSGSFRKLY
ncbi:hypothetical protein MTP99_005916 [Tenebrio molitor]|nr:hypothetical protein MTP99_005916 [Tenebrio molitor]